MEITNQLDRLPMELIYYIADIIESDRLWREEKQRKKDYLEENFIRYKLPIQRYEEAIIYRCKNGNITLKVIDKEKGYDDVIKLRMIDGDRIYMGCQNIDMGY